RAPLVERHFFFQAEDGIRHATVTGVQTCALPISWLRSASPDPARGYTREDFAAHIRNEHSTFRWLLESIRVSSGFEVERADFSGLISTARIHASSAETLT